MPSNDIRQIVVLVVSLLAAMTSACGDTTTTTTETTGTTSVASTEPTSETTLESTDTTEGTTAGTTVETTTGTSEGTTGETSESMGTETDTTDTSGGLPPGEPGTWNWVDIPGAFCRDGSGAGIGVRYGTLDKLMIFFEGGGACFNVASCHTNVDAFGEEDFSAWSGSLGQVGLFNMAVPENPALGWHHIYVPYCTGDLHGGTNVEGVVDGVPQQFVGFDNVLASLPEIAATFTSSVENVMVVGHDTGSFGALLHLPEIADAFPSSQVSVVGDSGFPLAAPYPESCLQTQWQALWDLQYPDDCGTCSQEGEMYSLLTHLSDTFPEHTLGIVSSQSFNASRILFSHGANDCAQNLPSFVPFTDFESALLDLRDTHLAPRPNWGTYYVRDQLHTWLIGEILFNTEVDEVLLVEWIEGILSGSPSHVGID